MKNTHVTARAVQLAVVVRVEVDDVDRAAAVMLDDLIACLVSTTANDPRVFASLVALDGDRVLAHILEPNKVQGAGWSNRIGETTRERKAESDLRPLQWTPSAWFLPMMTFWRVAPPSRRKTASASPPSAWSLHAPDPRSYFFHPPIHSSTTSLISENQ